MASHHENRPLKCISRRRSLSPTPTASSVSRNVNRWSREDKAGDGTSHRRPPCSIAFPLLKTPYADSDLDSCEALMVATSRLLSSMAGRAGAIPASATAAWSLRFTKLKFICLFIYLSTTRVSLHVVQSSTAEEDVIELAELVTVG